MSKNYYAIQIVVSFWVQTSIRFTQSGKHSSHWIQIAFICDCFDLISWRMRKRDEMIDGALNDESFTCTQSHVGTLPLTHTMTCLALCDRTLVNVCTCSSLKVRVSSMLSLDTEWSKRSSNPSLENRLGSVSIGYDRLDSFSQHLLR